MNYLRRVCSCCILYSLQLQPVGPTYNRATYCQDGQSKEAMLFTPWPQVSPHKSIDADEILEEFATGTLSDTNAASLEDYRKQLKQKAGVFVDIDQKIIDEAEFKTMILESKDLQTTL